MQLLTSAFSDWKERQHEVILLEIIIHIIHYQNSMKTVFPVCWLIPVMSIVFELVSAKNNVPASVFQEELEESSLFDRRALDNVKVISDSDHHASL